MTPARFVLGVLCWSGCALGCTLVIVQLFGRYSWIIDQAAIVAPHLTLLCVVPLVLTLATRRWICASATTVAMLVSMMLFVPGRAPGVARSGGGEGAGGEIRVFAMNARGVNPTPKLVVDLIAESEADVVVLLECSWVLWSLIQADERISARLPFGSGPVHPKEWSRVKLSKWPLRPIELERDERWDVLKWNYLYRRSHIVERPAGEFVLGGFVIRSPRTPEWWSEGNDQLVENCSVIRDDLAPLGLPIIVGVDLNATPSGSRTDTLRRLGGLRRTKPWLAPRGTWPSENAPWARVAIDDVVVSQGIRVSAWKTNEGETGSDHVAVEVGLVLPD